MKNIKAEPDMCRNVNTILIIKRLSSQIYTNFTVKLESAFPNGIKQIPRYRPKNMSTPLHSGQFCPAVFQPYFLNVHKKF